MGRSGPGLADDHGRSALSRWSRAPVIGLDRAGPGRAGGVGARPSHAPFSSCRRPVATEGAEHLVEVGGDDHLVVEEILQPKIIMPVGQGDERQQIAEADANGRLLAFAVRGLLG